MNLARNAKLFIHNRNYKPRTKHHHINGCPMFMTSYLNDPGTYDCSVCYYSNEDSNKCDMETSFDSEKYFHINKKN